MSSRSTRVATAFALQVAKGADGTMCGACVAALGVSGAGITLMSRDRSGPVCSSNPRAAALEDLQFTLGEGPCRDAFASGLRVSTPHLDAAAAARWPAFVDQASQSGVGAFFAFPLGSPVARIGVLTIYQDLPGDLSESQNEDSTEIVEVLTETMLTIQGDSDTLAPALHEGFAHRAEVHQATGMVSAQLEIKPADALALIRAHAYAHDRPIGDVAADIVGRTLRLSGAHHDKGTDDG